MEQIKETMEEHQFDEVRDNYESTGFASEYKSLPSPKRKQTIAEKIEDVEKEAKAIWRSGKLDFDDKEGKRRAYQRRKHWREALLWVLTYNNDLPPKRESMVTDTKRPKEASVVTARSPVQDGVHILPSDNHETKLEDHTDTKEGDTVISLCGAQCGKHTLKARTVFNDDSELCPDCKYRQFKL